MADAVSKQALEGHDDIVGKQRPIPGHLLLQLDDLLDQFTEVCGRLEVAHVGLGEPGVQSAPLVLLELLEEGVLHLGQAGKNEVSERERAEVACAQKV